MSGYGVADLEDGHLAMDHAVVQAFVSVYVDWAASTEDVRNVIEGLTVPAGVDRIDVVAASATDTLGCRVAVELSGTFDEQSEGRQIARAYAEQLSATLGHPAFALHDLILAGSADW